MTESNLKESFYSDGSIAEQSWRLNGELHRDDGPAEIIYRRDGSIYWQEWYLNGKRHRSDGPASIKYKRDGSIERQEWWLNGKKLTKEEIIEQKRKIANRHKLLLLQSSFSSYHTFEKWLVP